MFHATFLCIRLYFLTYMVDVNYWANCITIFKLYYYFLSFFMLKIVNKNKYNCKT